ncbi:MAG: hypothetical protein R2909_18420 [Gemmatimonadales bacterium]
MSGASTEEAPGLARQLARQLPREARALTELREPAATAEAQLGVALAEMRQMSGLADPHYLPALIAVGRAYLAASGRDPVAGTAVNPDYTGVETELAERAGRIASNAAKARRLSRSVARLRRDLRRSERRVRALERRLRQWGGAAARSERG